MDTREVIGEVKFSRGMNMFEMAEKLEKEDFFSKKEFLSAAQDSDFVFYLLRTRKESIEGYLYPGEYSITQDMTAEDLITEMVDNFLEMYERISDSYYTYLTRHEVVTLASMIEKEAMKDWEKTRISSVFHNRMEAGMRLQSDPTVYYGLLRETGSMPSSLRKTDFKRKIFYNTYMIEGLPRGPITNPNEKSLRAALSPENTSYFYFVSDNKGTHNFNTDFEGHKRDVRLYKQNRARK